MADLTYEERKALRRAAEDARDAANPHYGPFVDLVAHPLRILALLDMADRAALAQQPSAIDGWKLVPVDPTVGMLAAAHNSSAYVVYRAMLKVAPTPPAAQQPSARDLEDAALLFVLWHHQGGSSDVGQPIRKMLGLGQHDHMTPEQCDIARRVQSALSGSAQDREDAAVLTSEFSKGYELGLRQRTSQDHEDAERLDWLEQHDGRYYNIDRISSIVCTGFLVDVGTSMPRQCKTLRCAIDVARAAKGE